MSELSISTLDYIDQRTKSIINGYIKEANKLLHQSVLKNIPTDINILTLLYVDDHFMMHRASYQWKIQNTQQLNNILSSPPNFCFNSDIFEMSKFKYILQLYPNGNNGSNVPPGDVALYAKILSFPPTWRNIIVQQTLFCHETNTKYHCIKNYQHNEKS